MLTGIYGGIQCIKNSVKMSGLSYYRAFLKTFINCFYVLEYELVALFFQCGGNGDIM